MADLIRAFPLQWNDADTVQRGMTLRDYLAAASLANAWATGGNPDEIAEYAYMLADAMLKVRDK